MAKKKTTKVNRRRVLTDPVFELTRQNNTEFARACTANRLLRRAFKLANACMLTGIAASLSLEEETWPVDPVQTDLVDIIGHPTEPLQLQLPIFEHKSFHAIIIALGIEFFHEIHNRYQPVEKKHNALAVVKVFPGNEV